jgi:hypothetical protein
MSQYPSIGRVIHYRPTEEQAAAVNRRREHFASAQSREAWPPGAQAHVGNRVRAGQPYPAIVTAVWPEEFGKDTVGVNAQVLLDGSDSFWITSVREGTEAGTWEWPPYVGPPKQEAGSDLPPLPNGEPVVVGRSDAGSGPVTV